MRIIGLSLVTLGIIVLVYGGVRFTRQRTLAHLGPFKTTAAEQHDIPLSPIVGAIVLICGFRLLAVPRLRLA